MSFKASGLLKSLCPCFSLLVAHHMFFYRHSEIWGIFNLIVVEFTPTSETSVYLMCGSAHVAMYHFMWYYQHYIYQKNIQQIISRILLRNTIMPYCRWKFFFVNSIIFYVMVLLIFDHVHPSDLRKNPKPTIRKLNSHVVVSQ